MNIQRLALLGFQLAVDPNGTPIPGIVLLGSILAPPNAPLNSCAPRRTTWRCSWRWSELSESLNWRTTSSASASQPRASYRQPASRHWTSSSRLSRSSTRHCGVASQNRSVASPTLDGPKYNSPSVNRVAALPTSAESSGQLTQQSLWTPPRHRLCSATIRTPLPSLSLSSHRFGTFSRAMGSAMNQKFNLQTFSPATAKTINNQPCYRQGAQCENLAVADHAGHARS
jgi:hypothetical protein